jgi:hypothetical protein
VAEAAVEQVAEPAKVAEAVVLEGKSRSWYSTRHLGCFCLEWAKVDKDKIPVKPLRLETLNR